MLTFGGRNGVNDIWLSHCSERSAGVATLKHCFGGVILHSDRDSSGYYLCRII